MTHTVTYSSLSPEVFQSFSAEIVNQGGTADGNVLTLEKLGYKGTAAYAPEFQVLTVTISDGLLSGAILRGLEQALEKCGYQPPG